MSSQLAKLISLRGPGKRDSECARSRTAWPRLAVELKAGRGARPGSNRRYRRAGLGREQARANTPIYVLGHKGGVRTSNICDR